MKTAAVVIDSWKLEIFKRHLDAAERTYTEHPGVAVGTLTLQVKYVMVADLMPIIEAANEECANAKRT